jgi:Cof subfamily protein (haloacid dehalogenase superfamily)
VRTPTTGASPIRLLASDLDGTLLRVDGTVSDVTRDALAAAEEAGMLVAFVTGRPPRWLHEVAVATAHHGIAVAANGAMTYDLHTETVLAEHLIDVAALRETTTRIRARIPQASFAAEYSLDFAYESAYRHDWVVLPTTDRVGRVLPKSSKVDLETLITEPAVKLLVKGRDLEPDAFMDTVEDLVSDLVTVTRSGHTALVEISALGVTKASGLAALAAHHSVSRSEVAAVGDMPNDVPMLRWAGRSFAVANAHPAARDAAGEVLEHSNDEDAVAKLVKRLLAEMSTPEAEAPHR